MEKVVASGEWMYDGTAPTLVRVVQLDYDFWHAIGEANGDLAPDEAPTLNDQGFLYSGGVEWVPPEPRLEAPGVALRPFRVSDAAAVADACRDPAILRFTFMEDDLTEAGAVDWINEATEWWSRGQPRFAIVDPDDDRLLGQVGLGVNSRHLSGEGYYWVVPSERGRGVASAALGLVADWGFSKGIERLFLLVHPENNASNRLAERMGFVREGVLRSYEPVKDSRPDLVSWSLMPDDPRPWHT